MDLVVGIDMATAAVRAAAMDAGGTLHAEAATRLPRPAVPRPGWSEQDAGAWWPAACRVLMEVTRRLGDRSRSVVAVTVCSTSGTVVAFDRRGDVIGPALMYADQRAADEARIAQGAAAQRWQTLGLRIQPSFGIAKWAWLMKQPDVAGRVTRLGHASDVVVGRLTGAPAPTDWSHALKSGYDPLRREWVSEAMDALDIPSALLPDVLRPTEFAGNICAAAAAATGLPAGCRVRLGMSDACASQFAAGATTPGRCVSVLGSTQVLKAASQSLIAGAAGAVYSHRHPDGWWLPGGASSTGARSLVAAFPGGDLRTLDRLAMEHGPATGVVYPLVGRGERFPFTAPEAEGFTACVPTDEVDRYRAHLEGIAFVERLGFEQLASLGFVPEGLLAVSGGGSRSRIWNRIRATVLGRRVAERPGADTARGACILAAAGTIHADLATATDAMAAGGEDVHPDEREVPALEQNYRRFLDALHLQRWYAGRDRSF